MTQMVWFYFFSVLFLTTIDNDWYSTVTNWLPVSYKDLTIGVPKESDYGEKRVAQTPESVELLIKKGPPAKFTLLQSMSRN